MLLPSLPRIWTCSVDMESMILALRSSAASTTPRAAFSELNDSYHERRRMKTVSDTGYVAASAIMRSTSVHVAPSEKAVFADCLVMAHCDTCSPRLRGSA